MKRIPIAEFKNALELNSLLLEVSDEFGSTCANHRKKIRTSLGLTCRTLGLRPTSDFLDLDSRPQLKDWSVSISHTRDLGGFALSQNPVGFDIEQIRAINEKTVGRISTEEELNSAPCSKMIWVAKEAAFKSLSAEVQPKVLSDLTVHSWGDFSEKLLNYQVSFKGELSKPLGSGLIFDNDTHYFSLFRRSLSTLV